MRSIASTLVIALFLSSCTSIRMQYDAELKTEDGRTGSYVYQKSYDTSSIAVFCGLSAIFFGGACWYYTVMPTVPQENQTRKDALKNLDSLLKDSNYEVVSSHTDKIGWSGEREVSDLQFPNPVESTTP
jgi:hypothetical protein